MAKTGEAFSSLPYYRYSAVYPSPLSSWCGLDSKHMAVVTYIVHRNSLPPLYRALFLSLFLLVLSQCAPQQHPPENPVTVEGTDRPAESPEGQSVPRPSLTPEEELELFNANLNRA